MGPRLRSIVQAKHGFNDAVQLGGQQDLAGPAAIRTAGVADSMQLHGERGAKLRRRTRQNHRAARCILLQHRQAARDCRSRAARRRTMTLTSRRSAGSAGARTRAPATETRSLLFNEMFAKTILRELERLR
jgi:hypothetical protein